MLENDRYAGLSWQERQEKIEANRTAFHKLVYDLKQSGVTFSAMVGDRRVCDAYDATWSSERGWKFGPSVGVISKAYRKHCASVGIETEGPVPLDRTIQSKAISALYSAGWSKHEIAKAFGLNTRTMQNS